MFKMKILCIFILLTSLQVQASCTDLYFEYFKNVKALHKKNSKTPFSVSRFAMVKDEQGRVILKSQIADKSLMLKVSNELMEVSSSTKKPVVINYQGSVAIDISAYIDENIKNILHSRTINGPNCWNFSCYTAGLIEGITRTTAAEFNFLLKSPLVKEITNVEDLRAGDVLALRNSNEGTVESEVHGVTYLTPNLWFNKSGASSGSVFEVADSVHIADLYTVKKGHFLNAYRVTKLSDHILKHGKDMPLSLKNFMRKLKSIQMDLHQVATNPNNETIAIGHKAFEKVDKLIIELNHFMYENPKAIEETPESVRFLWEYVEQGLGSLG